MWLELQKSIDAGIICNAFSQNSAVYTVSASFILCASLLINHDVFFDGYVSETIEKLHLKHVLGVVYFVGKDTSIGSEINY